MRVLVIGGTGPTGPPIINGLIARGYEPIVLHRGTHEADLPPGIEHIHVDPHFAETLSQGLRGRKFDLVLATYGRLRLLPDVLPGHAERLITIGGTIYETILSRPAAESDPRLMDHKLYRRIAETEETLARAHAEGRFVFTHFRYPNLYGPRQMAPREWSVIRRILDGRRSFIVLDGGLTLESRAYVDNAAHAVLLAVDHLDASAGQVYNVADEHTPSDADRLLTMARLMGADVELVNFMAEAGRPAWYWGVGRSLTWSREGQPPTTKHQLLDISKMVRELGYRDPVGYEDAMRRTVDWYLEHRPERGGEEERQLGDPFDYAAEDAYLDARRQFIERLSAIPFAGVNYEHPYAHPKVPTVANG
jgi:nucleoside-diphosphate-sugar epimerase